MNGESVQISKNDLGLVVEGPAFDMNDLKGVANDFYRLGIGSEIGYSTMVSFEECLGVLNIAECNLQPQEDLSKGAGENVEIVPCLINQGARLEVNLSDSGYSLLRGPNWPEAVLNRNGFAVVGEICVLKSQKQSAHLSSLLGGFGLTIEIQFRHRGPVGKRRASVDHSCSAQC